MLRHIAVILAVASLTLVACRGGSSTKYTCKINGQCFKCPNSDAMTKCVMKMSGTEAGCTAQSDSYCK